MPKLSHATRRQARELGLPQRVLLASLAGVMRLWTSSLRFRPDASARTLMGGEVPPSVAVLWHNRLFPAPEFFRRYFRERRLAALISASGDGAWLAAFLRGLGIRPVRGSRHRRGAGALRELIAAQGDGFDVAITPDGSRGPLYEMKPGAIGLALKTEAPLVLLSFNFDRAWRLKTWDGFYLPLPFSGVEVRMVQIPPEATRAGEDSLEVLTGRLKARLDAMTVDAH